MMRLSKEEKTVLKTGINKSLSIITFILISEIIFPQIPFKGFGKLNSFNIDSGYTSLVSLNYNANEYSDLIVFNQDNKNSIVFNGKAGLDFFPAQKKSLPTELSKLKPVIKRNGMIESYVFASRKTRTVGTLIFSAQGRVTVKNYFKFDYFPENISISDIYPDGNYEVAVSGNSFAGISILSFQKNKITETKIKADDVFKDAHFIDLNSDGNLDIAALNTVDNKIHLLYKNNRNDFDDLRQIKFNEKLLTIGVFDVNYDNYKDIMISSENDIKIIFGDAYSSYNKIVSIKTTYSADKFVIGDFNRDGYFDFNYINIQHGVISTIFAETFEKFYPELIHKKEQGVIDIIPYFSKFVYGSAYLYSKGKIEILSKVTSMSEDQQLAVSTSPDLITAFDHVNNGIADLAFTDNKEHKLKFILRDASGLPERIFELPLYEYHSNVIEFSNSKYIKTFFLFAHNKNVIEAIEINFENYKLKRNYFYTKSGILDFAVKTDAKNDAELYILYSSKNKLCLQVFSKTNLKYSSKEYENLASSFYNPFIVDLNLNLIGVWQKENGFLNLNLIRSINGSVSVDTKLKLKDSDDVIFSYSNPNHKSRFNFLSILKDHNHFFIAAGNEKKQFYGRFLQPVDFRITSANQLFFGKRNTFFIYEKQLKTIYEISPDKTGEFFSSKLIFNNIVLDNYIIQMMDQQHTHFIYTYSYDGLITIKQLPF